ncbi:MAG: hypothetical protein HS111_24745 [Kofleriaceae bacterium]|nr:hypothetical protein [Kofleriaceae bacterium]
MVRVLVADDDPLAARQVAEVVGEEVPHEVEVATSAAARRWRRPAASTPR